MKIDTYQARHIADIKASKTDEDAATIIDKIYSDGFADGTSMQEPRLFWVVNSPDENPEIFATKDQATTYAEKFGKQAPYTIGISEVRNYYLEDEGWNYEDFGDTFKPVITIVTQNDTRPAED